MKIVVKRCHDGWWHGFYLMRSSDLSNLFLDLGLFSIDRYNKHKWRIYLPCFYIEFVGKNHIPPSYN